MKRIIKLIFVFSLVSFCAVSQQSTEKVFFAQGMLQIESKTTMDSLQTVLRNEPFMKVVRLDWYSKRIFILTQGLDSLSLTMFESWFGQYATQLFCIQIGEYGVDAMNPYPFANCN